MNKNFLLTALIFFQQYCFGQTALPRIENDTLYTTCGYKVTVGQEIKLGIGTRDNGDFKFITVSRNSWLAPGPKQASLRKKSNHHVAVVKKIVQHGNAKNGYIFYIVIGVDDIVNYESEVDNAIAAGEIVVPDEYKHNSNKPGQPISVADEITKLKKLYDDGVITKEEFEAQKEKLLEGN